MPSRNPIAKALRSPHLRPKAVHPKKGKGSFRRKAKHSSRQRSVKVNAWSGDMVNESRGKVNLLCGWTC